MPSPPNGPYTYADAIRRYKIALTNIALIKGKECGFRILQFNAVVQSNESALALYRKLGFVQLGIIPGGFRMKDGSSTPACRTTAMS